MTILIQRCDDCGSPNYPARAVCRVCLSDRLTDHEDAGDGVLLATSLVHRSLEPANAPHLPLRIGAVRLASGPHVVSFVASDLRAGDRVRLAPASSAMDEALWVARRA
ncbi:zinc ribbon domain-containing protein [Phenylobacterium sp. LjRoot225]|uniref:Zn-ribbon domain-containing OB-fold protein n=1 Tax=Phenylobacterium sp. LjRoot225 TaxID=3342285 RepID=UPI003ECEBADB